MLIDIVLQRKKGDRPERFPNFPGFYIWEALNYEEILESWGYPIGQYPENMPNILDGSYGVVDSPEQLFHLAGHALMGDTRKFIVCFVPIRKENQPYEGGWRWHKWGTYYGSKDPKHEYLYDEDDSIQEVWLFKILEIL
jgi:hypothetical protein